MLVFTENSSCTSTSFFFEIVMIGFLLFVAKICFVLSKCTSSCYLYL